jgi:tripartite-type tricarboxylate transporter receptor subunit TctC
MAMNRLGLSKLIRLAMSRQQASLFFFVLLIGWNGHLSAQTSFYQGKTIRVVIGSSAGGGYDLWARHLARYMGKYIPGNPELVPQNMPGQSPRIMFMG